MAARTPGRKPPTGKALTAIKARAKRLREASRTNPKKRYLPKVAQRQTSDTMRRTFDRYEVFTLKARGLSYRQIGQRLGMSHVHALQLAYEVQAEYDIMAERQAPVVRHLIGERMDEIQRVMTPILHGQVPARRRVQVLGRGKAKRMVAVPEPNDPIEVVRAQGMAAARITHANTRLAALYGADAPIKIAPTDVAGTRRYHEMSDDDLEGENRRLRGLLGETVIDVTPGRDGDGTL